jgi:hypothetical protein
MFPSYASSIFSNVRETIRMDKLVDSSYARISLVATSFTQDR